MKSGDSTPTREGMNKRKLSEIVSVDLPGAEGKPIAASISDDCAIKGKRRKELHNVPLASEATDNNTTKEKETPVSTGYQKWIYQKWMKQSYIKWMLPHHRDLQRQGCRIYTGQSPRD
jgi:hypothetical protein